MSQEGGESHQTLGGGKGASSEMAQAGAGGRGAGATLLLPGRFPEPRLTSTGQLDHNSPVLLHSTRKNISKLCKRGPSPTKTSPAVPKQWAPLGCRTTASCPHRDGSAGELPAQDTAAPGLVSPLYLPGFIPGFSLCMSPPAAFPCS